MRKPAAAVGSAVFFVCVPLVVGGIVPGWLSGWWDRGTSGGGIALVAAGAVLVCAGAGVMIHSFIRFVTEGIGTPAPVAPTLHLVVGGLYRYVRNPMYLAVLAAIVGQALLLQRPTLWLYALAVAAAVVAFVHGYEEPALRRQFGAEYETYRRAVPAWVPRLRPWSATGPGHVT